MLWRSFVTASMKRPQIVESNINTTFITAIFWEVLLLTNHGLMLLIKNASCQAQTSVMTTTRSISSSVLLLHHTRLPIKRTYQLMRVLSLQLRSMGNSMPPKHVGLTEIMAPATTNPHRSWTLHLCFAHRIVSKTECPLPRLHSWKSGPNACVASKFGIGAMNVPTAQTNPCKKFWWHRPHILTTMKWLLLKRCEH